MISHTSLHRTKAKAVVVSRTTRPVKGARTVGSQSFTGMLVLLLIISVIGFLLTAAILNSAIDPMEAFSILAVMVIGAIAGFAHLLKAARAVDTGSVSRRPNGRSN